VRQRHSESAVGRAKTNRRRQSDFAPGRPPQSVFVAPSGIEDHRGRIPSLPDDLPRTRPRRFRRPHGLWRIYVGAVLANQEFTIRARPATTPPAETCRLRSLESSGRSSAAADPVLARDRAGTRCVATDPDSPTPLRTQRGARLGATVQEPAVALRGYGYGVELELEHWARRYTEGREAAAQRRLDLERVADVLKRGLPQILITP
jgi:hypothetical protein